jgi:hypothetical protein
MTGAPTVYQLLLAGVALAYLAAGVARFFGGRYRQTFIRLLLGSTLWGAVLVLALFPKASHVVSERLGFGENLNTLIFIGFVLVFIGLSKLLGAVERLERSVTEIVRRDALLNLPVRPDPPAAGESPRGRRP